MITLLTFQNYQNKEKLFVASVDNRMFVSAPCGMKLEILMSDTWPVLASEMGPMVKLIACGNI